MGNCFLEIEPGIYQDDKASHEPDIKSNLLQFSRTDDIDFNIVNLVSNIGSDTNQVELEDRFLFLYFYGYKTQEGPVAGCVLLTQKRINNFSLVG